MLHVTFSKYDCIIMHKGYYLFTCTCVSINSFYSHSHSHSHSHILNYVLIAYLSTYRISTCILVAFLETLLCFVIL